jgi:hypothetical protein
MSRVLIVVDALVEETGKLVGALPTTARMVDALKDAMARHSPAPVTVDVIPSSDLADALLLPSQERNLTEEDIIWSPLTLDLPNTLQFPARNIFQACSNVTSLRQRVQQLGYETVGGGQRLGDLYLPVVLTAKGPLYGEVISEGEATSVYQQPVDLPDNQRQPLYHLAYQLLQSLSALPAVYLLQFGYNEQNLVFDRLWPFPGVPAIASIGIQEPDLFTCHWHCLTGQPILDLTIIPKDDKWSH